MYQRKQYDSLKLPLGTFLKRLWELLGSSKKYLGGSLLLELIRQGGYVLRVWLMALMLEQLVKGDSLEIILWTTGGVLLLSFVTNHLNILNEYFIINFRHKTMFRINQLLSRHLLSLSIGQHVHTSGGIKTSSVFRAESGYQNLIRAIVWDLLPNALILLWLTIAFFTLDFYIALIFLFIIIAHISSSIYFNNKHIRTHAHKMEGAMRALHHHTHATFDRVEDIKLHNQENKTFTTLKTLQDRSFITTKKLSIPHFIFRNSRRFFLDIPYMAMIVLGALAVQQNHFEIGSFVLITSWGTMAMRAISGIGGFEHDLATQLASVETLFTILDTPNHLSLVKKSQGTPRNMSITFQHVSFSYPTSGGLEILEDHGDESTRRLFAELSLTFASNKTTALVGHSGAGKSTIMKLILRYFDVNKGVISLGGVPLTKLTLEDLYSYIGLVPQDIALPEGTIREALLFATPHGNYGDAELLSVLRQASLGEFIEHLPQGLDTQIGERGVKLSGGERQRLAIARILLRNPKVLLFDEATSHLDSISEKLVQRSLQRASKNRTTIIIAHRLSTVKHADKIIVMQNGKVIADGSHGDLMKTCPHYREMVEEQELE